MWDAISTVLTLVALVVAAAALDMAKECRERIDAMERVRRCRHGMCRRP